MRVAISASTFVRSSPYPAIVHVFTGEGASKEAAHAQASALLNLHRKADVVFRACTAKRVSRGVFIGQIEGIDCKTTIRIKNHKDRT